MKTPRVTIACVPRESFSVTQQSLETLYQRTSEPFELVYIDGGSPSEVRTYLERAARTYGFTLLRTDQYLSPNQARNIALGYVTTPYVAFVDNDALVSEGWLKPLADCAEQTGAWAVGPLYFEFLPEQYRIHMAGGISQLLEEPDGTRYYREKHHYGHSLLEAVDSPLGQHETELIEFHAVLISMAAFEELGPLDEGLLSHAEHSDICLLIRQAGQKVFLEPQSRVTHVPPSQPVGADRDFFELRWSDAWNEASLEHFVRKWNLSLNHRSIRGSRQWLRHHRRETSSPTKNLVALLGPGLASWLDKSVLQILDSCWNRLRYPRRKFGTVQTPTDLKVVLESERGMKQAA